jgi:antitoxin component of MazEF toxin-antitoxin module
MEHEAFEIWPMHEAFYFESMFFLTASAVRSVGELSDALKVWSSCSEEEITSFSLDRILNPVQNIIQQGAALSRYFWPSGKSDRRAKRAKLLKEQILVSEQSALKSRTLRNIIEHFDEKLDDYLAEGITGQIIPEFVGDLSGDREVQIHVFRGFDPATTTFEILGNKFEVGPIVAEIMQIEVRLSAMRGRGQHSCPRHHHLDVIAILAAIGYLPGRPLPIQSGLYIVDTCEETKHNVYTRSIHEGRGLTMKATVKKWGNSAAVRIPAAVMQAMHLDLDEVVDVREEAGRIVIEPVRQKAYDLDKLLKGITSKNLHKAVDFGSPQGKEAW